MCQKKIMHHSPAFFPILFCVTLGFWLTLPSVSAQIPLNTITLDNQSGDPVLVQVIGPTRHIVKVPKGEKRTVHVTAGKYYLLARYGQSRGEYRYTKGESFDVTQIATQYSMITITLHKVVGGNYSTRPISAREFEESLSSVGGKQTLVFEAQKRLKELGYEPGPLDGIWGKRTQAALERFQQDQRLVRSGKLDEATRQKLGIQITAVTDIREGQVRRKETPRKRFIMKVMPRKNRGAPSRLLLQQTPSGSFNVSSSGAGYRMAMVLGPRGFEHTIWDAGSEVSFIGKGNLESSNFESDAAYPLTFKLIENIGYVYLCGRGTVTTKTAQTYRLGYKDTIDTWLSRLHSRDELDREGAAQALGWLSVTQQEKQKAILALINALRDEKMEVRRNAAEALGKLNDAKAAEPLSNVLKDPEDWVAQVAMEVLLEKEMVRNLSEARITQFIQSLESEKVVIRRRAIAILGAAGVPGAVEPLLKILSASQEETETRVEAARALGQIGDVRAVEPLLKILSTSQEKIELRAAAARALRPIGDTRAIGPLRILRQNANAQLREAIDEALWKLERQ